MAGAAKKEPAVDLAIVMGKPKGAPRDEPMASDEPDGDEGELPAGFEEAFSEAFPEAAGDAERMQALKRLIHLCAGSY
ncbi:MAG TPA: hypothetical protein VER96_33825 [Polyangiaceae bacterium]|nr:hypothetical protein [Polyangiaceae bacterium]